MIPLELMARRQHCPLPAIQRGAVQSDIAISPAPVATRPRPPRTGARPAAPRPPAATTWDTAPLAARRANPPGQTVTVERFKSTINI